MTDNQTEQNQQAENAPTPFSQLVMMLATSALQQLGQIPDPASNNREVNLHGAQAAIDLLDMLQGKTKGNLDDDESRVLGETLNALRMHYVQVANSRGETKPGEGEEPSETQPPPQPEPEIERPASSDIKDRGDDEDKRKYHKSYG